MFSRYLSVHNSILSESKKFAFKLLVNFDHGKSETGSTQDWGRTCRRLRDDGFPPRAPDFFMKLMWVLVPPGVVVSTLLWKKIKTDKDKKFLRDHPFKTPANFSSFLDPYPYYSFFAKHYSASRMRLKYYNSLFFQKTIPLTGEIKIFWFFAKSYSA